MLPAGAAAFTFYSPVCTRLTPTGTASGSDNRRGHAENGGRDASDPAHPRNRHFLGSRNSARRHNPSRPGSSEPRFNSADPKHASQDNQNWNKNRSARGNPSNWPPSVNQHQGSGERFDDDPNLSDVDDTVDGGFFSRYRKEATPGRRLYDFSSLDAPVEGDASEEKEEDDGSTKRMSSRMDRQAAVNAFDAVDKLFGSINSGKEGEQSDSSERKKQASSSHQSSDGRRKSMSSLNRETWLDDVRARAATTESKTSDGDNNNALDVDVVEAVSNESDWGDQKPGYEEQTKNKEENGEKDSDDEFDEAEITSEHNGEDGSKEDVSGFRRRRVSHRQSDAARSDGRMNQNATRRTGRKVSFNDDAVFQNLMRIARQGPNSNNDLPRRRPIRSQQKNGRSPSGMTENDNGVTGRAENKREPRAERNRNEVSPPPSSSSGKPDVSRLLGLTKQIISNQISKVGTGEEDDEDADDEMEKTIIIKGYAEDGRKASRQRQSYPHIRRFGGLPRRVRSPPEEWRPMTDEEVANLVPDSGGRISLRKKGFASECQSCRGTGLDTCSICMGTGWLKPLAEENVEGPKKAILEEIWSRPNLVIDYLGEAQCVMCNGIGKQFCTTCRGSGSALRKGFSLAERDEVFDNLRETDEPDLEEVEYDEDDDEEEDEDEGDREKEDDFQLYQGPEEVFGVDRVINTVDKIDSHVESDGVEVANEALEVEDESAEFLAALEAMHLADAEEEGMSFLERVRRKGSMTDHEDDDDVDDDDDDDDEDEDFAMALEDVEDDEDGIDNTTLTDDGLDTDDFVRGSSRGYT